ncbi:hypothetical protein H3H37_25025 [Duganella sp. LX20W]|uniref:Uncharacterized protein n=1 Tax=Rugamonas brunnea TaxID=2758569 RepID=A0A7W2EXC2_9BURK|nr:hypothetical protein [Rugamonas brunnea]MBA5640328.1 hypothetical protein [Rugamonas brunnea]
MPPAGTNARTFCLQTPADLFRKMQFEAHTLRQAPPDDLSERAYAVMNAVTSAWQMKDWVYEAIRQASQLDVLHRVAGRRIAGTRDFGNFLTANSPWMNMSFQLATAAKHFVVNADAGPEVITMIDFQIDPAFAGQQPVAVQEIMVRTRNNSISGPDLVLMLVFVWGRLLLDLGLITAEEAT